ncbi:MAG: peptidase family protein [Chloroflexi bacterium]|nr:peptidase family protein [Chloroflexota bacterium]
MSRRRAQAARLVSLLVASLLLAGCGAAATPAPSAGPSATAEASAGPPAASGVVSKLEDVQGAVVQIESQGTFVDPGEGETTGAGRGTGAIIDPSGIAVTNNHVVTGAALIKVWIGGDTTRTYNAKVLGVSECSDLAVIDIEGDGFPYLSWYEAAPKVGQEVYLAGYPLGEPEYTLTKGIVSKADAPGDTTWASVDTVVMHDAQANRGNSGGPLITPDGQIVAVEFAGNQADQSFAIGVKEVNRVLSDLRSGKDVTSIGVNGQAVADDAGNSGIWVASVASGSPADEAGVKPGDLITRIEGLPLAADGTMGDYCDILRSHEPTDELKIQVWRPTTNQVLEGNLNGPALALVETLGGNPEATPAPTSGATPEPGTTAAPADYAYVAVSEENGRLTTELPSEWSDTSTGDWTRNDEVVGARIGASTNYDTWVDEYTVPGIFLGVSTALAGTAVESELDSQKTTFEKDCTYDSRFDFNSYGYTGKFDAYRNCGGTSNSFYVVVLKPEDGSHLVMAQVVVLGDRDLMATDHAIETLKVSMP